MLVRFNAAPEATQSSQRRMLLTLQTQSGCGFEIFVQPNGNVVVAALTRREYLTSATATKTLLDGQWHYLTVAITPPKRPFSYSQINIYVDFVQKLSATLKVQAINEPFTACAIGAVVAPSPKQHEASKGGALPRSSSQESGPVYKGMLPSLLERTLSANVSSLGDFLALLLISCLISLGVQLLHAATAHTNRLRSECQELSHWHAGYGVWGACLPAGTPWRSVAG